MKTKSPSRWFAYAVSIIVFLSISSCGLFSGDGDSASSTKVREKDANKPSQLQPFQEEARLNILWRRSVGRGMGKKFITLSPNVIGESIYVADAYGLVAGLDRSTGRPTWSTRIGQPYSKSFLNVTDRSDPAFVTGGVGVSADMIYVGTARGEVIALTAADGEERWRVSLTSEVLAPPTASRDAVFAQSSDGNLFALDQATGQQNWVFHSQDPLVTLRGTSSPVFNSGIVYAGFGNGLLVAIDEESGELIWEQTVSLPKGTSELDRMVDVDGVPLVEASAVVAAAHQGVTRAMRRADGQIIWEAEVSSTKALQSGYGLVFVVSDDSEVVALEQRDGTEAWRQESLSRRGLSDPLAFSNYIFVGDAGGFIHVLAQSDGRLVARRRLDGTAIQPTLVHTDGVVYVQTQGGNLYALELERLG